MQPSPSVTAPSEDTEQPIIERALAWLRAHPDRLRHEVVGALWAVGGITLASLVIAVIHHITNVSNISLLYLLVVIALAWRFGLVASLIGSVLAFFTYNFFFITPYYTFTVSDPSEWVALFALLGVGIVVGQLTAQTRRREQEAIAERERIAILYRLAQDLAGNADGNLAQEVTRRTLAIFGERGVIACTLFGPDAEGHPQVRAISVAPVPDGGLLQLDTPEQFDGAARAWEAREVTRLVLTPNRAGSVPLLFTWFVPLLSSGERVGVLALTGPAEAGALIRSAGQHGDATDAAAPLFAAVTAQMALALDRAALQREAIQAAALRETDRLRSVLLGSITHDLRTPIAAIKAAAGSLMLPDMEWDDASRREMLSHILTAEERLSRMVDNILMLSRLEAGAAAPQKEPYLVEDIIGTVLGQLDEADKTGQHPISVELPEDAVLLAPMDHAEIERVLLNLVENAIKYAPPTSPITIQAEQPDDHTVAIRVIDHGMGVPADARAAIFDKFYRIKRALPWDPDQLPAGTGLGLTISEGIVRAHGGQIWVEDTPGGGATFVFTLPTTPELSDRAGGEVAAHVE